MFDFVNLFLIFHLQILRLQVKLQKLVPMLFHFVHHLQMVLLISVGILFQDVRHFQIILFQIVLIIFLNVNFLDRLQVLQL